MLGDSELHANIPASDLNRARKFYTDTLGLPAPSEEDEMTLTFQTPGGSWFQIYETSYAGTGQHTIAQWVVDDIEKEVGDLRSRGVVFEEYDMPGLEWQDGIASGPFGRVAWFKDSEGNVMCIDQRAAG